MRVTVDLRNIDLTERIKQVETRRLSGNFIIISGKHSASFSYRNGKFQKARYDNLKGKEAMEKILTLKEGILTINIIEKEKEKEQLWRIIENLPDLLFCGIVSNGKFNQIVIKKETGFYEEDVNNFIQYLRFFEEKQKENLREITLIYRNNILKINQLKKESFAVFLFPFLEDIRFLDVSIRNISMRLREVMFSENH